MNSTLMLLLHSDPFAAAPGGTEMHVLDRVAGLALPRAVIVYPYTPDCINVALIRDGNLNSRELFSFPLQTPLLRYAHTHPEAEEMLVRIAGLFAVTVVSVEHALYFPLAALRRLQREGIKYVTVHHDFYCVCPSLNLIDIRTFTRCRAHTPEPQTSVDCLRSYFEANKMEPPCLADELLAKHQRLWRNIFESAERIIFPSISARDTVISAFPTALARAEVISHGYTASENLPGRPAPGPRLRVALIGQIAHKTKGRELILELLAATRDVPLEWHFFGDVEYLNFMSRVDEIGVKRVFHGPYQRENIIPKLAGSTDVALFTSIWSETFSYTLSEALLAGVPPIVPRLGAFEERVAAGEGESGRTEGKWGWIIEPNSVAAAATILEKLAGNRTQVGSMQKRLAEFKHTTPAENAEAYRSIYAPFLDRTAQEVADNGALVAAATEYFRRRKLREAELLMQQPAYKRSILYGAYKGLKHLVPVSVRNSLYRILVGWRA